MKEFSLKQAIKTAIQAEDLGIKYYSKLAIHFADREDLKSVFELLSKDEVEHKHQFEAILHESGNTTYQLNEDDMMFLEGCDISKFFPAMENISIDIDVKHILQGAFEFEKESVLFYSGISDFLGNPKSMQLIIAKEKGHMTKLMKYIITESKFRGIEDHSK
jgi:rubrerythrin